MTDEPVVTDDDEEFDPEEADRRIVEFIRSADELGGTPVAALADRVVAVMGQAHRQLEEILGDEPNNKALATMLLLSRRFRDSATDSRYSPEQWQLSAASTMVNSFIRPEPSD